MGQVIELAAADGHRLGAYAAGARDGERGLVVLQEVFGVNAHMRLVADRLAAAGYAVVCPALFDRAEPGVELGYGQEDIQRGVALRAAIPAAGTLADLTAAAAWLGGRRTGVIGYCWGGSLAWLGATEMDVFAAACCWYGGGIAARRHARPRCPVQMHFGATDASIPRADVEAIRVAQPEAEIFVYPEAGHGFGCEARASYREADARLAEERSLAFFARHLG